MLIIRQLRKAYRDVLALDGIDLHIAPGEVLGLIGPNGAGKSTLASIVAGLTRADSGTVLVGDRDVTKDPASARALVGFSGQELGLAQPLSTRENVSFHAALAGLRGRALRARVDETLVALRLDQLASRPVHALSGGEKRRVHTAMALVQRPPLLLLDEPTAGVDVETRNVLLQLVRSLADDGTSVCYTTHYLTEVETIADRVTMIDAGRVVASGPLHELLSSYGDAVVALEFDGPPPVIRTELRHAVEDATVRIFTPHPAIDLAHVVTELDAADQVRLRSVEVVRPSLEAIFIALTKGADTTKEELCDVPA